MIWDSYQMDVGTLRLWRLGPLDLWLQHAEYEWRSATRLIPGRDSAEESREETGAMPEDLETGRWATKSKDADLVSLRPATPDRPVVVRTAAPLTILPGGEAEFFVSIPLWVEIFIAHRQEQEKEVSEKLLATPTVILSNSWFGLPTGGESCYALRSRARRSVEELEYSPCRVVCPARVRNESSEHLLIQRLFLPMDPLRIYRGDRYLWGNAGTLRYQGEDKPGQVVYDDKPPGFDHAGTVLREARQSGRQGFLARSFSGLKEAFGA